MSFLVLDVSKYNVISDYNATANEIDGVLIRVGYRGYSNGNLIQDSLFQIHYDGFKNTGIKIGYYWFTQAISEAEAIEEADYVYSLIKDKKCDFPIYIDSEYSNNNCNGRADTISSEDRTKYIISFCERIEELGYRAGVYASDSWFVTQLNWASLSLKEYSIWDASYSANKPYRVTNYDAWQYTSYGTISGCTNRVDLSYFYNDIAGWSIEESYNIEDCTIITDNIEEIIYWGGENKPVPTVKNKNGQVLILGTDYTISYADNINAGKAAIVIRGIGQYSGNSTVYFTINPRDLATYASASCGSADDQYCYDTNNITVTTTNFGDLVEGTDYTVEIIKELAIKNSGYVYYDTIFTVTGINNWGGQITSIHFDSRVYDISKFTFTLENESVEYTGSEIKPTVSNIQFLTEGIDFTAQYENNINAGIGTIKFTGTGKYSGTNSVFFNINPIDIENVEELLNINIQDQVYTGSEIEPEIESEFLKSINSNDYSISYSNNINSGESYIYIDGLSPNCEGQIILTFNIEPKDLSNGIISYGDPDENGIYDINNLTVKLDSLILVRDKDFSVDVIYNVDDTNENANVANVTISGINNYTGSIEAQYKVSKDLVDINSLNPTIYNSTIYTGEPLDITIEYDGLTLGTDYIVTNGTHTDAGIYDVIIKGIGKYTGIKVVQYIINSLSLTNDDCIISYGNPDDEGLYDIQNYSISYNGKELINGVDYNIDGEKEDDEDYAYKIYHATAILTGNYNGVLELESNKIEKCEYNIEDANCFLTESLFEFTGSEIKPKIASSKFNLIEGKHYQLNYSDNINVGTAIATVNGLGGFIGSSDQLEFTINALNIDALDISLKINSFEFDGQDITLEFEKPEVNYDISYDVSSYEKRNAGSYKVELTGIKNFKGKKILTYEILPKNITNNDDISISCGDPDENGYYDLNNISLSFGDIILTKNIDYLISNIEENKVSAEYSESRIYIEGINNLTGSKTVVYKTARTYTNINILNPTLEKVTYDYTGSEIKPIPTFITDLEINQDIDYTLSYYNNIDSGAAVLIIAGIGDYNGSRSIQFYINPYSISEDCNIECGDPDENGYYDIKNISVKVEKTAQILIRDIDYTLSTSIVEEDNTYITEVVVTGIGNYKGSYSKKYRTGKVYIDISEIEMNTSNRAYEYSGEEIIAPIISELKKGVDYTAEYINNIQLGTAEIIITGIGDYNGTKTLTFKIVQKDISEGLEISCGDPDENGYYNLDNLMISINNNELILDRDYQLSITTESINNVNVLSHLIITGKGNYTGEARTSYLTGKYFINIANITFYIDKTEYDYTGYPIKPEVHSNLIEDFDYKLSYYNNINSGTAIITITGIGNYTGEKKLAFKINMLDLSLGNITCGEADGFGCYDINNLKVNLDTKILKESVDYTIKISVKETEDGYNLSSILVTGINNYSGELKTEFKTEKVYKDIRKYDFYLEENSYLYTGSEHTPNVICDDLPKSKYIVYYKNNKNAGKAQVTIYGTKDYNGQVDLEFDINPVDISSKAFMSCGYPDDDGCYNLDNIKIYLEYIDSGYMNSTDYKISIEQIEEDDYLTAKVTATGIGNYTGSISNIFNIRKMEQKENKPENDNVLISDQFKAGDQVKLKNVTLYPRYSSKKSNIVKSGTYFIWNNYIINNRIRITTKAYNATKPGQIIGWIDLDTLLDKTSIEIGDLVEVTGNITKYADGTGNTINKNSEYMYVVDLLEESSYCNNIGLASGPNNTRQGWANLEMVKKIK